MYLDSVPFDAIYSGLKLIELRLYDEKRKKIYVGDIIKFYKRSECSEDMECNVIRLFIYTSIMGLVETQPYEYFGPRFHSKEQLFDKLSDNIGNYTKEGINKYELLAIKVELI